MAICNALGTKVRKEDLVEPYRIIVREMIMTQGLTKDPAPSVRWLAMLPDRNTDRMPPRGQSLRMKKREKCESLASYVW